MHTRPTSRPLTPAELALHATRVAALGHDLGADQDLRIRGDVYPAAWRLTTTPDVDRCLLHVQRKLDQTQASSNYFITLSVSFLGIAGSFGIGAVAVFSTTRLYFFLMWVALVFVAFTVLVTQRIDTAGQRALLEVRERYERRRLDLLDHMDHQA